MGLAKPSSSSGSKVKKSKKKRKYKYVTTTSTEVQMIDGVETTVTKTETIKVPVEEDIEEEKQTEDQPEEKPEEQPEDKNAEEIEDVPNPHFPTGDKPVASWYSEIKDYRAIRIRYLWMIWPTISRRYANDKPTTRINIYFKVWKIFW